MNLANKLTISRIFLTFIFMFLLFSEGVIFKVLALFVFITASFTDFLDGFIAKKRKEISAFGKFMDPIADKVLVIAAFLAFVEMKLIPAWIIVIIISREFIITGIRLVALARGEVIASAMAGKHKTVSQMFSIYVILFFIVFRETGEAVFGFWNPRLEHLWKETIFGLMIITALLTLISGTSFIVKNKRFFKSAKDK